MSAVNHQFRLAVRLAENMRVGLEDSLDGSG